jgi:hypothetical protein
LSGRCVSLMDGHEGVWKSRPTRAWLRTLALITTSLEGWSPTPGAWRSTRKPSYECKRFQSVDATSFSSGAAAKLAERSTRWTDDQSGLQHRRHWKIGNYSDASDAVGQTFKKARLKSCRSISNGGPRSPARPSLPSQSDDRNKPRNRGGRPHSLAGRYLCISYSVTDRSKYQSTVIQWFCHFVLVPLRLLRLAS